LAIAARTRPELIVVGEVTATREARKKADNELYANDVTISSNGGSLYVRIWVSSNEPVPAVGSKVAFVVQVGESERNGAELVFARQLTDNDLDLVVSSSKVLTK
jgi:hypothetical protein